jgi:multidrug efflux pump subunit AcrA (membrane-fusion protein)
MSVSADIIVDSKTDVLIVPTAAISNTDGVSTVKVIKDNQISQVSVEVGISDNSNSEIIAGLNEGDVVITSVNNSETKTNKSPAATQSVFGGNRFGGMGGGMRP